MTDSSTRVAHVSLTILSSSELLLCSYDQNIRDSRERRENGLYFRALWDH